ncbi:MAG: hypothetical protein ACXWDJ_03610 [Aeromicrobium sp.]
MTIDEDENVDVSKPKKAAAGLTGVRVALQRSVSQMGFRRTARTLLKLNQADGFDCMSCAWPDPDPEKRGGHPEAGDAGVLRRPQHRRPRQP